MGDRIIGKADLADSLDELAEHYLLVAPLPGPGGRYHFRVISGARDLSPGYLPSALPPTKFLRPPQEALLNFAWNGELQVEPVFDERRQVIFGVRPCDLHAIQLLDEIFDYEKDDGHYQARRRATTIIGIECLEPCDENCFCREMGTLEVDAGFDLLLTPLADAYHVRAGSDAGRLLLGRLSGTREAVYEDRRRLRKVYAQRASAFEPRLDVDGRHIPGLLADSEDSLLWDVLGEKCLSCGACTNACPTCFCFDVHDEVGLDLHSGERYRHWDSCQLEEFAMVGTGESFRQPRSMRVKHRFNHKGRYLMERYALPGCVGCGRCGRDCLVGINPIEVFNQLKGQPVER